MKVTRRRLPQPLPLDAPTVPPRQPAPVPGPAPVVPTLRERPTKAPKVSAAPKPVVAPVAVAQRQRVVKRGSPPPVRKHPADRGGPWSPPKLPPVLKYPESSSAEDLPGRRGQSPGAEPGRSRALNESPPPAVVAEPDLLAPLLREILGAK